METALTYIYVKPKQHPMRGSMLGIMLTLITGLANAQTPGLPTPDRNPLLTSSESAYLNSTISGDSFDFNGKRVGYVAVLPGGLYGIGTFIMANDKRFTLPLEKKGYRYELLILDTAERRKSLGFDAVVVKSRANHQGKRRRTTRNIILNHCRNQWIEIPENAGLDSGSALNEADVRFFNALYSRPWNYYRPGDFTEKKVAMLREVFYPEYKVVRVSIPEYVRQVRHSQEAGAAYVTYVPHHLTPAQKTEAGGYDMILQHPAKKGLSVDALIAAVKNFK